MQDKINLWWIEVAQRAINIVPPCNLGKGLKAYKSTIPHETWEGPKGALPNINSSWNLRGPDGASCCTRAWIPCLHRLSGRNFFLLWTRLVLLFVLVLKLYTRSLLFGFIPFFPLAVSGLCQSRPIEGGGCCIGVKGYKEK